MAKQIEGAYIPAVTAFEADGALSLKKTEYNILRWNESAVTGYMCLGSNGEFRMLDEAESWEVIKLFAECRAKDKQLLAGVGRESLYHTRRLIDKIAEQRLDIDFLSVLTPHYFRKKMDDRALEAYFTEIADASPYPILLYCAPGFANEVCISPKLLDELAAHPNILGIKDTSADQMDAYMDAAGNRTDFSILAGSIGTLEKCLERGGSAGVLSAANYFPDECAHLFVTWKKEGKEAFEQEYRELRTLIGKTGGIGGVCGVKCCMNLLGYQAGYPRRPLLPLSREQQEGIKKALEERR